MATISFQYTALKALTYADDVVLGYCVPGPVDKGLKVLNIRMAYLTSLILDVPPYRVIKSFEIWAR
uniref:Uncharacterized protein n=1 Tax=Lepeophtheirus salmonis TaxID=72036 RepID=A0A0K2T884_LEPSM